MKKTLMYLVAFAFIFVGAGACGKTQALDVEIIWSRQDVLDTGKIVNSSGGFIVQNQVTINIKPPYFTGSMPLKYMDTCRRHSMMDSSSAPLQFEFNSWHNIFIYPNSEALIFSQPAGAVAVSDTQNAIIAECRIKKMPNLMKGEKEVEVEEIHYNSDGKPIFTCLASFSNSDGFKTGEKNVRGKKEKDYFFIWPVGLCSSR